jgi:hypothetical protein
MGPKAFVALADALTEKYGERFRPNALLREMAKNGEGFYERFADRIRPAARSGRAHSCACRLFSRVTISAKRTIFLAWGRPDGGMESRIRLGCDRRARG